MGIFGTYGAFSGLGKPSIKLEFEDNEALVAFSKKMQDEEPAPVQWSTEEEMFTPVEGVRLSEKVFFDALEYNAEPYVYRDFNEQNIISVFGTPKHREDSFGNVKYAFVINTPLKGSESKVYIWKDMNHALFDNSAKEDRSRFWTMIKPTIERPAIVFEKGGKNHFVKCFKTGDGQKVHFTFIPALVNEKNIKTFIVRGKRTQDEIYKIYNDKKGGGSVLKYLVGSNATINGADWLSEPILFVECRLYADKDNSNISDRQTFSEKNSLDGYGDRYELIDNRKKQRKNIDDLHNISSKDIQLKIIEKAEPKSKYDNDNWVKIDLWKDEGETGYYSYIHFFAPDTKTNNKGDYKGYETNQRVDVDVNKVKDLNEQYSDTWHKKYYIGFVSKAYYKVLRVAAINKQIEMLEERNKEISKYYDEGSRRDKYIASNNKQIRYIKDFYSLGRTANNTLYNNLDILDYRGMQPTYKILDSYDQFFKPAANKNSLKGWGLDDTKKLIADTCRNHYKECAAIAQHLKGDCKLQSAFNLWHWLHHNIRYEYDREGREEVRTPARVWQDRHRGVDCDCLSVFVWCVLRCMGYDPAFELAAFKGKPAYSHIYINLDGIVIDRVWFVFNSRPPLITKTELFKVGTMENLGQLF